jgi:hypothetical protein
MNPGFKLMANRSFGLSLYDLHVEGVSTKELAEAYSLPVAFLEQRIEATRLCLKHQVKLSVNWKSK